MAVLLKLLSLFIIGIAILSITVAERLVSRSDIGVQVYLADENMWQMGDNRRRRATVVTGLTDAQHQEAVDKHNELRAMEGASNMIMLQKNQVLAEMAQEWAETCKWEHGNPHRNASEKPYSQLGQNLHMVIGSKTALDIAGATQDWYNEKSDYTYDTLTCGAGKKCGHYTQVVWADTKEMGCGAFACDNITQNSTGQTWNDVVYIVCNYGPPGNYPGVKPFKKGSSCKECSSGQMTCYNNLCYEQNCEEGDSMCSCAAECSNCGQITEECRCNCTPGWSGHKCTVACVDTQDTCEADISYCTDDVWRAELERDCPVTCGVCSVASDETPPCSEDTDGNAGRQDNTGHINLPCISLVPSLLSILLMGKIF